MSHTQGSSPVNGGSSVDQSCVLVERILGLSAAHKQSERGVFIDKGLYVIKQGSSYVMISVIATGAAQESALVRVTAQVVAGVRPEPQLLRQLLILNGKLRFGAFAYEPDGELILFSHALLGGSTLNANEVLAAVHDVALVAARCSEGLYFLRGEVAVSLAFRDAAGGNAGCRVAVDSAILLCHIENRPQQAQCGHFRPRSDRQVVDKRLDVRPGDLIDRHVAELRLDT